MSDNLKYEYEEIYYGFEPDVGKLRLTAGGIGWKTESSGKQNAVYATEFRKLHWLRVARNHQLRITTKDGGVVKFDGFKKEVGEERTLLSLRVES